MSDTITLKRAKWDKEFRNLYGELEKVLAKWEEEGRKGYFDYDDFVFSQAKIYLRLRDLIRNAYYKDKILEKEEFGELSVRAFDYYHNSIDKLLKKHGTTTNIDEVSDIQWKDHLLRIINTQITLELHQQQ